MKDGKFNVIVDAFWGSSGKGKISTWLADHFNVTRVSSSNSKNAGHTVQFEDGTKFVSKAIPSAAILKKVKGTGMKCYLSPGSGFDWPQLFKEWKETGMPEIDIHERASIVTEEHARREREGNESTSHIASTMQGSGTSLADKILRRPDCKLAWNTNDLMVDAFGGEDSELSVRVLRGDSFRSNVQNQIMNQGHTWLHEVSQGYALSIDHGSHYPACTARNCGVQSAMDHMAIPPKQVGDVYLNLRTKPIRVGNLVGDSGEQIGYSGDFYPDCTELTWDRVAQEAEMPPDEAEALAKKEKTTVTKRIRRVCSFSFTGLKDAVRTNGATKLVLNFAQYIDWKDHKVRDFDKLSRKTREFVTKIEESVNIPVVLIGTGALHEDIVARDSYL